MPPPLPPIRVSLSSSLLLVLLAASGTLLSSSLPGVAGSSSGRDAASADDPSSAEPPSADPSSADPPLHGLAPGRRLVSTRHGQFLILDQDTWVGRALDRYGEWCEHEVQLFRALLRPGDTVVDVGANIGAFSVPLARFVGPTGRVIAFEAQVREEGEGRGRGSWYRRRS